MLYIKILSAISLLFCVYPIHKFIKRNDINIFDCVILFHTINFVISPLKSSSTGFKYAGLLSFNDSITLELFFVYAASMFMLLIIDFYWTKTYGLSHSLLNITQSLRNYCLRHANAKESHIYLCLFFSITMLIVFLPKLSFLFILADKGLHIKSYAESSSLMIINTLFSFFYSYSLMMLFLTRNNKVSTILLYCSIVIFMVVSFFLGRRIFLQYILLYGLVLYSLRKNELSIKSTLKYLVIIYLSISLIFPIFNVIRNSNVFKSNNPIESIKAAFNYASLASNKSLDKERSQTSGRSVFLFAQLYNYIKLNRPPLYGRGLLLAADHAVPAILNPNKGAGSQAFLEKYTGTNKDGTDSMLYLFYADFKQFAFIEFSIFLILLFYVYNILGRFCENLFSDSLYLLPVIFSLFYCTYNVETDVDGMISSCFTLFVGIFILYIINTLSRIRF